ncbi:DNA-directed RNA polymerase subunit omega [Dehalobacterium formicoaceticum]|uniref:DNA-directed RNA polymerase subunit omega n=1 Tax=Dehalobacterium formicoaceticum TaxID=51515 RepID=A0ABT1Y195_9FIRM|nr:DNA-directed RNA polymerase subunit omega [Dehalobacterium formicoaceticum]MCR6544605.1 DNA-directed RNA polymerase subunit omega [Dehalobacterium formicoaceticum]
MIKPSLDELMEKVDSKYTLVEICAQIARRITEEEMEQENNRPRMNPVSSALWEIADGYVTWERTKTSGIK